MSSRETVKVLGEILKTQMQLTDDQILLSYEKFNIKETPGLFIDLSYISGKPIGSVSTFDPVTNIETLSATMHELIQIDVLSFDDSARLRKEEIIMSLNSVLSQQLQEKYNLQIARIGGEFLNASSLEETKILNRFTISVAVTSLSTVQRFPDYYDQFRNVEEHVNV